MAQKLLGGGGKRGAWRDAVLPYLVGNMFPGLAVGGIIMYAFAKRGDIDWLAWRQNETARETVVRCTPTRDVCFSMS